MWSSGITVGTSSTLQKEDIVDLDDDSSQIEEVPEAIDDVVHDDVPNDVSDYVHNDDDDNDDDDNDEDNDYDDDDLYTPEQTHESNSRFMKQINDWFTNDEKMLFSKFAPKYILTRIQNNITIEGGKQMAEIFLMACGASTREIYREQILQFVSSLYLQRKYVSTSEVYIAPIERKVFFGSVEAKFYYIPIIKTIKQLLSEELISLILEETEETSSEYIRANNLTNKLRLIIYGDDFTVTNPIGTASKTQKIYAAYLDVDNWPIYKTKSNDIPAIFFVHRNTIDKFDSIDKVLEYAVNDLIKLKVNVECFCKLFNFLNLF